MQSRNKSNGKDPNAKCHEHGRYSEKLNDTIKKKEIPFILKHKLRREEA